MHTGRFPDTHVSRIVPSVSTILSTLHVVNNKITNWSVSARIRFDSFLSPRKYQVMPSEIFSRISRLNIELNANLPVKLEICVKLLS